MSVKDDAGKELVYLQEDLVSVQLPLQPAFVNPGFYPRLDARTWRHELTGSWYDKALAAQDELRRGGNPYAADSLEVLMYGTFVKAAEQMGRSGVVAEVRVSKVYAVI